MPLAESAAERLIDFTAGSLGGVANVYSGQPLDTVKVKMQTYPELYRNALKCFGDTWRRDGIRGLYAGTTPALIANVAENAVLFSAYGACQRAVCKARSKKRVEQLNTIENGVAGFFAGFMVAFVLCPLELIKCRMQAMHEYELQKAAKESPGKTVVVPFVNPVSLAAKVIREEGVATMFKGLRPTIVREAPGYLIFFAAIERTKEFLTPAGHSKEQLGLPTLMLSGGVGGVALWTLLFPFDVVKSRIQVQSRHGEKEAPMMRTMFEIGRQEGFRALYKGLGATIVRTFIATAFLYSTVTYSKRLMYHITGLDPGRHVDH